MLNKETILVSLKLFIITAIAALCLAVVNKITFPIIEENRELAEIEAQKELLPVAVEFKESELIEAKSDTVEIGKISVGLDDKNVPVGYVVTAISNAAYGGEIKVMVGVDKEGSVTRVKIAESAETPGLGARASKPEFTDKFIGVNSELRVVKGEAKENEISAISSATITSKAVTSCVNAAMEVALAKEKDSALADTAEKMEQIEKETNKQIAETEEGADEE